MLAVVCAQVLMAVLEGAVLLRKVPNVKIWTVICYIVCDFSLSTCRYEFVSSV